MAPRAKPRLHSKETTASGDSLGCSAHELEEMATDENIMLLKNYWSNEEIKQEAEHIIDDLLLPRWETAVLRQLLEAL